MTTREIYNQLLIEECLILVVLTKELSKFRKRIINLRYKERKALAEFADSKRMYIERIPLDLSGYTKLRLTLADTELSGHIEETAVKTVTAGEDL